MSNLMDESRGSSDQEDEQIVQVREALMCPKGENFGILRTARFLNYTTTSIDDDVFELPLDALACRPPEGFESDKLTAKISFSGWGSPSVNWIEWVNMMAESHNAVWKKSGVYDAILASRYQIKKHDDLIMALAEKWCVETNTFVFPWGEATVTLEDMIVLGGFSVTGNNALTPIKREDMKEVEEKMKVVKREIEAKLEKKCSVSSWMKEMMNSGNEIEHEAFMVSWLSRFVFHNSSDLLRDKLFSTAVQLVKGVKLALAPAVLARIYCDLGVLKEFIAGFSEKDATVVKSPFQFVQVWALERFLELQPPGQPSQLKSGEPRIARWHHHGGGQDVYGYPENVRAILDSTKESFDYRPYTKPLNNFKFPKFYSEDDCWSRVRHDETIIAFGRCLRFAKLVGLDCIEPYYPHRVALQFGYDQDLPGLVPARIETPELAWKGYIRPITDEMLYLPARLHKANVTVGYIRWWKLSIAVLQSEAKKISQKILATSSKQKPVTITTTAMTPTTSKATSFSSGKLKTAGKKVKEMVKNTETKTKRETSVSDSQSLKDSEQATKRPLNKTEWVQRSSPTPKKSPDRSFDNPESVQKSHRLKKSPDRSTDKPKWIERSPKSRKSPDKSSGRASDDVKGLKGALRSSGETKGHGHVTFQLPSSPGRSPSVTHTHSPKQNDLAQQSSSFPQDPSKQEHHMKNQNSTSSRVSKKPNMLQSCSASPLKRKKLSKSPEAVSSRGQRASPSPQVSKAPYKTPSLSKTSLTRKQSPSSHEAVNSQGNKNSPSSGVSKELNKNRSVSGSPSLTKKKSPRSSETINSCGQSSPGKSSMFKRNIDKSIIVDKQESPSKTQLDISKTNVKLLEEMVTLQEQVGEDGEVTYQIPKQQFEDLSKGVHDVLHDLQCIKFALNIQDNDDE